MINKYVYDYPLHTAKLYELFGCVDHVLKSKNFIFSFPFSCFSSRQNWGGYCVNNIRPEPYPRVQSHPLKNKISDL